MGSVSEYSTIFCDSDFWWKKYIECRESSGCQIWGQRWHQDLSSLLITAGDTRQSWHNDNFRFFNSEAKVKSTTWNNDDLTLPEPMMAYPQLYPYSKNVSHFELKFWTKILSKIASENIVCKMSTIMFPPRVNLTTAYIAQDKPEIFKREWISFLKYHIDDEFVCKLKIVNLGTNFSEIWMEIQSFAFKEIHWKMHDGVFKWKHFPRYWPFVRGIHQASDAELWCFLWSAPE